MKKEAIGDRGKYAEKEVEKVLKRMNDQYMGFAFDRQPDARAARGTMKAALCDFLWWWNYETPEGLSASISGLLEVKATEHEYRLAKDRLAQLPRMRKVTYAGGYGVVLVYHSTLEMWRAATLVFFAGDIPPSWDLSKLPLFKTPEAALCSTGLFPTLA